MDSNLYTKDQILRTLASKGHFTDPYALDAFFQKSKIEAIFENEKGEEFFDGKVIELIIDGLFKNTSESVSSSFPNFDIIDENEQPPQSNLSEIPSIDSLNLPTVSPLASFEQFQNMPPQVTPPPIQQPTQAVNESVVAEPQRKKVSILAGALEATGQTQLAQKLENAIDGNKPQIVEEEPSQVPEDEDFDDISLLSESFEAQEKFKEYVLSEMAKKNMDITPPSNNEFKLDISEKTINMVARTLAKKIAKHVNALCSQDMVASEKLNILKEHNQKLEKRAKELEDQNKKLRLLLTESNKNLNSYQPSFFGFYRKITPKH